MSYEVGDLTVWKDQRVSLAIGIISLLLAGIAYWDGKIAAEHTKELQEYVDSMKEKYVDVRYGYSTFGAETSFHTQFTFTNIGTVPATEVKIRLTYPAGTEIQRVAPSMKFTESEDNIEKLVEIEIQRLDVNMPLGILVTSSHEPVAPPQIQCHEQKSVKIASEGPP